MGSNPQVQTVGISPKVAIPTYVLVGLGALLMVLDLLKVVAVDDEVWQTLLGTAVVTGATGYAAKPGDVQVIDHGLEQHDLHDGNVA
jgi:hypothetical protein